MGSAPSRNLCQLELGMWNWWIDSHITISAEHLPGSQNQVAAWQEIEVQGRLIQMCSRQSYLRLLNGQERPLHSQPLCLLSLCEASRLLKLEIGSRATAVNALCQPWGPSIGYAFPPFCMIGRCLAKITSEKVPWILVTPPSLVLSHLVNVGGNTATTPKPQENINEPTGEQSSHGAAGSSLASYPGERRPGIDCLCIHNHFQKNLGIGFVGEINTYAPNIFLYHRKIHLFASWSTFNFTNVGIYMKVKLLSCCYQLVPVSQYTMRCCHLCAWPLTKRVGYRAG